MAGASFAAMLPRVQDPNLEYTKYLNFLIALRERRLRLPVVSSMPLDLTVDLSMACQLRCPYCPTGTREIDRPAVHLSADMNQRILSTLGDTAFIIWYFAAGEPLLNPRYAELIAEASKRELFSVISTNLSFPMSDVMIDAILHSGLGMMCVALDGATPETYVQYRRGGKFELVVDNLQRLIRRKRELGLERPIFEWRFLIFKHNQHEVPGVRQLAEEWGLDSLDFFYGMAPADATPDMVQATSDQIAATGGWGPAVNTGAQRTDTTLRRWLGAEILNAPPYCVTDKRLLNHKCDFHYYGSIIHPDGQISPCSATSFQADDFGRMPEAGQFSQVWNNAMFQKARRMFSEGEPADIICARCPMPSVMDFNFQKCIDGILANAPDWVLAVLAADPHSFFPEVDLATLPTAARLARARRQDFGHFPAIAARLTSDAAGDTPRQTQIRQISHLLGEAPQAMSPPPVSLLLRARRGLGTHLLRPILHALQAVVPRA